MTAQAHRLACTVSRSRRGDAVGRSTAGGRSKSSHIDERWHPWITAHRAAHSFQTTVDGFSTLAVYAVPPLLDEVDDSVNSTDFGGCAQLQRHRYDRSSTAALSDIEDHNSHSGPSASCFGIRQMCFPADLLEMSSLLLLAAFVSNHQASLRGLWQTSRFGVCGRAVEPSSCRTY